MATGNSKFKTGDPRLANRNPQPATLINPTSQRLTEMFDLLLAHFGPQDWWPAETELEMMVGAVLTQNTNWKNAEKAIENLKLSNMLTLDGLASMDSGPLARTIRPAGYYNIKAKRLRNLMQFIVERYNADLSMFLEEETQTLREGLLSVKGVGPETADSIMLYAAKRPIFVIDAYTHRILYRHSMCEEQATYNELQELFMDHLNEDASLFGEFHALLVRAGKDYCRRNPFCNSCPLEEWGPDSPLRDSE